MDFEIAKFFASMGHGTIIDMISNIISTRVFLVAIWIVVIGVVMRRCKAKRKIVLASFILSAVLFYTVSELGFKTLGPDIRGFRERPYVAHLDIQAVGHVYNNTSFPSSHMANVLAVLTVAVCFLPGIRSIALLLTLIMAWSRMHNGMHYPSDVFVGAVLGILYGLLSVRIVGKMGKNR